MANGVTSRVWGGWVICCHLLSLDTAQTLAFQQWLDQVVCKILLRTGWVAENTEWCWRVSGGAFLLYFRAPSEAQTSHYDSPYVNSVSILIPLTPDCPLPHFYLLPHQTLQKGRAYSGSRVSPEMEGIDGYPRVTWSSVFYWPWLSECEDEPWRRPSFPFVCPSRVPQGLTLSLSNDCWFRLR